MKNSPKDKFDFSQETGDFKSRLRDEIFSSQKSDKVELSDIELDMVNAAARPPEPNFVRLKR